MVGLRFTWPNSSQHTYSLYGSGMWGFIFGGSQYVFDLRNSDTGLGWSMLVNGGMTLEFGTTRAVNTVDDMIAYPFALGGEIDFKTIYNFHKYVGATFGFSAGYSASLDASGIIKAFSGDESASALAIAHGFHWGFNIGLIF